MTINILNVSLPDQSRAFDDGVSRKRLSKEEKSGKLLTHIVYHGVERVE